MLPSVLYDQISSGISDTLASDYDESFADTSFWLLSHIRRARAPGGGLPSGRGLVDARAVDAAPGASRFDQWFSVAFVPQWRPPIAPTQGAAQQELALATAAPSHGTAGAESVLSSPASDAGAASALAANVAPAPAHGAATDESALAAPVAASADIFLETFGAAAPDDGAACGMRLEQFGMAAAAVAGSPPILLEHFGTSACPAPTRARRQNTQWRMGVDCGSYLRRGIPLHAQAKVLLVNACLVAAPLPLAARAAFRPFMRPVRPDRRATFADRCVSCLTRVPVATVMDTRIAMMKHGPPVVRPVARKKRPARVAAYGSAGADTSPHGGAGSACIEEPFAPPAAVERIGDAPAPVEEAVACEGDRDEKPVKPSFFNFVRAAALMSSTGMGASLFPHLCFVVREAGGDVGDSYHSAHFSRLFDRTADNIASRAQLAALMAPMAGTGRCPDVEIIADSVSIGQYRVTVFGAHTAVHATIFSGYIVRRTRRKGARVSPVGKVVLRASRRRCVRHMDERTCR